MHSKLLEKILVKENFLPVRARQNVRPKWLARKTGKSEYGKNDSQ